MPATRFNEKRLMLTLDPRTTALVLIDLQKPIVAMPLSPYSGAEVVKLATRLADRFRAAGARVVLVNVAFARDFGDALRPPVDQPFPYPPGGLPEDWAELVDGLAQPGDLRVTKRQWGAFYGTDLDVQLRRRKIKTVVLGGIATNFGVESTAEQAWERGYEVVIAEDATSSRSAEMHAFSIGSMLPRISRIVQAGAIGFDGKGDA
jgi:nicotinamidase-related amidase